MNTVKMTFEYKNGNKIEKDIEIRLVSIYKAMGWKIKEEKKEEIPTRERTTFTKRNVEE